MVVDVIILTKSGLEEDREGLPLQKGGTKMTRRTIHTLKDSESDVHFKVHLMESGVYLPEKYTSIVENYIYPDESFNYNRFLNIALQHCQQEWVVISNDDVGYEKGWFTEIMKVHELRPDIHSFSPKDPTLYMHYFDWHFVNSDSTYFESYKVSEAVMGWCLVIKRESLNKILPFDEQFDMYFQDNDYVEMMKQAGIKHALVRNSIACHFETVNVAKLTEEKIDKMRADELKFRNKWKI